MKTSLKALIILLGVFGIIFIGSLTLGGDENDSEKERTESRPTTYAYVYHKMVDGKSVKTIPAKMVVFPDDPNRLEFVVNTRNDRATFYTFDRRKNCGTWTQGPYQGVFDAKEGRPWRFRGKSMVEMEGELVYPENFILVPRG